VLLKEQRLLHSPRLMNWQQPKTPIKKTKTEQTGLIKAETR